MPTQYIQFTDIDSNPLSSTKVRISPWNPPFVSASRMAMGDTRTIVTDNNGYVSASLVDGLYQFQIFSTSPETIAIGKIFTGSYTPYSASIPTGSAQTVLFDLMDILGADYSNGTLKLSPMDYNISFSGSVITVGFISSQLDNSGSTTFNDLIPGIKKVEAISATSPRHVTEFYISVPPSGTSAWNAKDLRVYSFAANIPIHLNPSSQDFVLSVSASDARYIQFGGSIQNAVSASHAVNSDTASFLIGASNTASYLSGSGCITDSNLLRFSPNASIADENGLSVILPDDTQLISISNGSTTLDWTACQLQDTNNQISARWDSRKLYNINGDVTFDWQSGSFVGTSSWASSSLTASSVYNSNNVFVHSALDTYITSSGQVQIQSVGSDIHVSADGDILIASGMDGIGIHLDPYSGQIFSNGALLINNGTASIAIKAISASYAETASYVLDGGNSSAPTLSSSVVQVFPDGTIVFNGSSSKPASTTCGIQEAINMLPTASNYHGVGGGVVRLAPGIFYTYDTIITPTLPYAYNLTIEGAGMLAGGIVLTGSVGSPGKPAIMAGSGSHVTNVILNLRNIIVASDLNATCSIIYLNGPYNGDPTTLGSIATSEIDFCWIGYWTAMKSQMSGSVHGGVNVGDGVLTPSANYVAGKYNLIGIQQACDYSNNNIVKGCQITYLATGIVCSADHATFRDNTFYQYGQVSGYPNDWPVTSPHSVGAGILIQDNPNSGTRHKKAFFNNAFIQADISPAYMVGFTYWRVPYVSYDDSFEVNGPLVALYTGSVNGSSNITSTTWTMFSPKDYLYNTASYILPSTSNFSAWNTVLANTAQVKIWDLGADQYYGNLTVLKGAITSSLQGTASYATSASFVNSASYSTTASYAANAGSGGTTLTTGSTYPITASWSNTASVATSINFVPTTATSASWASTSISSSYTKNASTASLATNANGVFVDIDLGTDFQPVPFAQFDSTYPGYTSFHKNSMSYQPSTDTFRAANFQGTASWATQSLQTIQALVATQSLYATQSLNATQSINAYSASWVSASVKITTADTGSYISSSAKFDKTIYTLTSSFAVSASYAPVTPSSTAVSASWASSSISASYAVIATNANGVFVDIDLGTDFQPVPFAQFDSTYPGYTSFHKNSMSYQPSTDTFRAANFRGTASWASASISSSYTGTAGALNFTPALATTATSASWASASISSSYSSNANAINVIDAGASLSKVALVPSIGTSQNVKAHSSFVYDADNDILTVGSISGNATSASYANTASYASNVSVATYTSSLFGTASWSTNALSSNVATSASWASASISSSYALTSSYPWYQTSSYVAYTSGSVNIFGTEIVNPNPPGTVAYSFTVWPTTAARNDVLITAGIRFQVLKSITVSKLGRLYVSGNTQNHTASLWISTNTSTPLATGLILSSSSSDAHNYKWVNITSTVLSPGNTYALGITEQASGDTWKDDWSALSSLDTTVFNSTTVNDAYALAANTYPINPGQGSGYMYSTPAIGFTVSPPTATLIAWGATTDSTNNAIAASDSGGNTLLSVRNDGLTTVTTLTATNITASSTLIIPVYSGSGSPSVASKGLIAYNSSSNFLYLYNGAAWKSASFA